MDPVGFAEAFEPFGDLFSVAGRAQTAYGFTGEWTDGSGLIHVRTRYYDPTVGRYFQADPWDGDPDRPQSFNAFGYVGNNPSNVTDPSGECYGPLEFLRQVPVEKDICTALDQALFIYAWPGTSANDRDLAAAYIGLWAFGHSAVDRRRWCFDCCGGGGGAFLWLYGLYLASPLGQQVSFQCQKMWLNISSSTLPRNGQTTTVIGRYPRYLEAAKQLGANALNIPTDVWNRLNELQRWALNRTFLDLAVSRGDTILLVTPLEGAPWVCSGDGNRVPSFTRLPAHRRGLHEGEVIDDIGTSAGTRVLEE